MEIQKYSLENIKSLLSCAYGLSSFPHIKHFKTILKEDHIQLNIKYYSDPQKLHKRKVNKDSFQVFSDENPDLNYDNFFESYIDSL